MKTSLLTSALVAMTLVSGAGDMAKAPMAKAPIEECLDLGAEMTVGYETDYIFNGIRFARDSAWADVNYTFDGLLVPVTVGAWYLNGINGSINGPIMDELRLSASAAIGTFAGFDADLGYTHYTFPEFRSNFAPVGGYGELGLALSRKLGVVDLNLRSSYAMGGGGLAPNGWYHELGLQKSFGITDGVSLVLGTGVAYTDGYWGGSGWNHYFANASLPISLNCRTTLTPYVGYVGAPDTWIVDGIRGADQNQSDILHGGVSLTVSF